MTQEDYNEIRDKHPSPEAEIQYQERLREMRESNAATQARAALATGDAK